MKRLLFIILTLILCSCSAIENANKYANKREYLSGLLIMEKELLKKSDNLEVVNIYQNIFNDGVNYYRENFEDKNLYNMEKSYLLLPTSIKNKLNNIEVNKEEHNKLGVRIANKIIKNLSLFEEKNYRDKVEKYNKYNEILKYDNTKFEYVQEAKNKLKVEIEKTYSIVFDGNRNVTNYFEDNNNRLNTGLFRNSDNPDLNLYINIKEYRYDKPNVITQKERKHKRWNVKDYYGNNITNKAVYDEILNIKKTSVDLLIEYKLVSNKTKEIIFFNQEHFSKEYAAKWKTYNLISFNGTGSYSVERFNDSEKKVPSEDQILEEIILETYKKINEEFKKLPYIEE